MRIRLLACARFVVDALLVACALLVAGTCSHGSETTAPVDVVIATDPASAQIVTSDLAHFWAAYDVGGKSGSTGAFQAQYLDAASSGLRDFISLRSITAASLAAMVTTYPSYFASIRAGNLRLATDGILAARVRSNFAIIKSLYPPAAFPPVTLLIGCFSTGGTTSANGMLIGSEFYSITGDTPLGEFGQFQRDNVKPIDSLPIIIAHEHAHILQARANGLISHQNRNLLKQAILEGGADFVGERSSGGNINGRLRAWALPRESALWAEFTAAMHGTDISRWLYNQGTATADRPGDLGYFIGYRIAEAFFARQGDKASALRDLIEVKDADDLLARSGYAP